MQKSKSSVPTSSPATPRSSRTSKTAPSDSGSNTPPPATRRLSTEKSPRAKPTEHKSPRSPLVEKRPTKLSELQQQFSQSQDELKKTKEDLRKARDELNKIRQKLSIEESSKAQALQDLHAAKKLEEETHGKLLESEKKVSEAIETEQARNLKLQEVIRERETLLAEIAEMKKRHDLALESSESAFQQLEALRNELSDSAAAKNMADAQIQAANLTIESLEREIRNLKMSEPSLTEMHVLLENLRSELSEAKGTEAKAKNMAREAHLQLEQLKIKMENAKAEESKLTEAWKSKCAELDHTKTELEDKKLEINSIRVDLERTRDELIDAKKREEDCLNLEMALCQATAEAGQAAILLEMAREEAQKARTELEQARLGLELAEKRYGEQLDEARMETDQIKEALKSYETKVADASRESTLKDEKYGQMANELERANAHIHELKASLMDKETELQSIKDENENLRSKDLANSDRIGELEKLVAEAQNAGSSDSLVNVLKSAQAEAESANAREKETLEKVRLLNIELENSNERGKKSLEELEAAEAAQAAMEADMKRLRVQTEQWKKAADAAATVLQAAAAHRGDLNGKLVERSVSLDQHILHDSEVYNLKYSSPMNSEDLDHFESSPGAKKNLMLRKFGALWRKKSHN